MEQAYKEGGFRTVIDSQRIKVNGKLIEIIEEKTDKKAKLTDWDKQEGVEAGDVVKVHWKVNGEEVSNPDEIWLSNRDRGSRYFSWLDVLKVNGKVAIIQRITDDNELEHRKWKIIWIDEDGKVKEEKVSYEERYKNHLAVKLINTSETSLIRMGYYSDVLEGYPSLFSPYLYPLFTGFFGISLCVTHIFLKYVEKRKVKQDEK